MTTGERCDTLYMVEEPDELRDADLTPYNIILYSWPEGNCETLFIHPNGAFRSALRFTASDRAGRGRSPRTSFRGPVLKESLRTLVQFISRRAVVPARASLAR